MIEKKSVSANPAPEVGQYKLGMILWMFAWPAAWFTFLIYVLGRQIIPAGATTPTWLRLLIIVLGTGAELAAGLILLRREGYPLTSRELRSRIRWQWPGTRKRWLVAGIVLVTGLALSMAMGPVNRALSGLPGFTPPDWWGAASNPTVQVNGPGDVFPDIHLAGNFVFVAVYFLIGLIFNVLGEEIYYRGYLLPKMHAVFGNWDWAANGVLFALKHIYQRWLYPGLLVAGLGFAFAAGPLGSLPLAIVYHWIGNFLINMVFLVMAVLGLG